MGTTLARLGGAVWDWWAVQHRRISQNRPFWAIFPVNRPFLEVPRPKVVKKNPQQRRRGWAMAPAGQAHSTGCTCTLVARQVEVVENGGGFSTLTCLKNWPFLPVTRTRNRVWGCLRPPWVASAARQDAPAGPRWGGFGPHHHIVSTGTWGGWTRWAGGFLAGGAQRSDFSGCQGGKLPKNA